RDPGPRRSGVRHTVTSEQTPVPGVRRRRVLRAGAGRPPWLLFLPALIGVAFLVLPFAGLLTSTPWSELGVRFTDSGVLAALWLSLTTATVATVVSLLFGVPLAWLLARTDFPGQIGR